MCLLKAVDGLQEFTYEIRVCTIYTPSRLLHVNIFVQIPIHERRYRRGIRDSERERLSRLCWLLMVEWAGPSSSSAPTLLILYYGKLYSHYSCTLLRLYSGGGGQP